MFAAIRRNYNSGVTIRTIYNDGLIIPYLIWCVEMTFKVIVGLGLVYFTGQYLMLKFSYGSLADVVATDDNIETLFDKLPSTLQKDEIMSNIIITFILFFFSVVI